MIINYCGMEGSVLKYHTENLFNNGNTQPNDMKTNRKERTSIERPYRRLEGLIFIANNAMRQELI